MRLELAFRPEQASIFLDELVLGIAELSRSDLTVQCVEQWLRIKGFKMAWSSSHE